MDIQISDIDTDDELHDISCGYFNLNFQLRLKQTNTENRIDSYTIRNNEFSEKEFNNEDNLINLKSEINVNSFFIDSKY